MVASTEKGVGQAAPDEGRERIAFLQKPPLLHRFFNAAERQKEVEGELIANYGTVRVQFDSAAGNSFPPAPIVHLERGPPLGGKVR